MSAQLFCIIITIKVVFLGWTKPIQLLSRARPLKTPTRIFPSLSLSVPGMLLIWSILQMMNISGESLHLKVGS